MSKQKRKSNIRLIAILFGLIFILYYGLAVYLPKIEKLVDAVLNQQ